MRTHIATILAAALFSVAAISSRAQSLEPFNPYGVFAPSAEAWQMTRYGGLTPSLYTGAMTYSLPLYTYSDPDFTIPVSLDYAFDGYRPAQHSGTVGYGWALNCGGLITREVRGLPDEGDLDEGRCYDIAPVGWWGAGTHRDSLVSRSDRIYSTRRSSADYIPSSSCVSQMLACDIFNDTPGYRFRQGSGMQELMYDAAPDIYHFRFLGHSGDFLMMSDGSVRVCNSDLPHGELLVTISPNSTSRAFPTITLRTGDGYRYVFETEVVSEVPNPDDDVFRPSKHVNTYRLYQIVAPNGRSASFSYTSTLSMQCSPRYNTMRDGSYVCTSTWESGCSSGDVTSDNNEKWNIVKEYSSALSGVTISGGATISFSYAYANRNENAISCFTQDSHNSIGAYLPGAQALLKSISVENEDGVEVEAVSLSHDFAASGTPKAFLSSVSSRRCGTHSFTYNLSGFSLPFNNTRSTDHWGFWNDGPDNDIRLHLVTTDNNRLSYHLFDQMRDSSKEASFSRAVCGALTRIEYPTGGCTLVSYEANRVSRRQNHHCGSNYVVLEPADSLNPAASVVTGGVRVAKLADIGVAGDTLSTSFSYSGGILMQMPRYSEVAHYVHRVYSLSAADQVGCTMTINAIGFSGCVSNPISFDGHVAYPEVTVTHPDGSSTLNTFTSAMDPGLRDDHSPVASVAKHCINDCDWFERDGGVPFSLSPVATDRRAMRGKPQTIVVRDASGAEVSRTSYSYSSETMCGPMMAYNNLYSYNIARCSMVSPLTQSVTKTGHGVTSRTDFTYNSLGQKVTESLSAAGDTTSVQLVYVHTQAGSSAALPAALHSAVKIHYVDGIPSVTAVENYHYANSSLHVKPWKIVWKETASSADSLVHTFTYDSLLRLTGISFPGGATVSYTWDGTHITRKTENGTSNRTDFDWRDLVGLTRISNPDGRIFRYGYDYEGRLCRIKNTEGKTIECYDYNLEND